MSLISITVYSKVDFIYEVMKTSLLKVKVKSLSIGLFATPWTVAHQAPLSMGFSRQESWSGLPFLSPVDLPDAGIKPHLSALQADTLPSDEKIPKKGRPKKKKKKVEKRNSILNCEKRVQKFLNERQVVTKVYPSA